MLNNLLSIHKKTVFFGEKSGNSVAVILKPQPSDDGFDLRGYTNFTGLNFLDGDKGYFGDSFELTINADDLFEKTNKKPVEGWIANVELPQMNNERVDFYVKDTAFDRTSGYYLLKCTAATTIMHGCKVNRDNAGGI